MHQCSALKLSTGYPQVIQHLQRYYQATIHKPIYIDTSETRQRDCYKLLQLKLKKVVDKDKTVLQYTHVQQTWQGKQHD